jgi:predicted nucleic-acid-binding protein
LIGLDTNVLVRYVVRDDPAQTAAATRLIESECTAESPGIVTLVVLCELVWVLERGYRYRRGEIAGVLRGLLGAQEIRVEGADLAWQALNGFEDGRAGFADFVIGLSARQEGAASTWTFDREAAGSGLFTLIGGSGARTGRRPK